MLTFIREYYFSVENLIKDMYLRRRMDSQGFVPLGFIAGFNRVKILSSDIELIKLVCQRSEVLEYRTDEDGQDFLRRKDGWEQWVLSMGDRDETAQNEGPKELRLPSTPHPNGFDQASPQWPMSAVALTAPYDASFAQPNGYHHSAAAAHDNTFVPENPLNGTASDNSKVSAVPNGHPVESAVSSEPDSFSDAQVASLTLIVRSHAPRTFSNGIITSELDVSGGSEKMIVCQAKVGGTGIPDR
jgi:la-related protein 1